MKKSLTDLREMLCKELDEFARKGELTAGSLETVHKITDTMKNIDKIMMLEEGGYSGADDMYARGSYANEGSYRRGSYADGSYGNGGGYSDESYRGGRSMRGYSRAEGTDMFREKINEMMHQGNMTAEERNALQRAMQIVSER